MAAVRRIANLFRRKRLDAEIAEELKAHIEMRIDDNIARGMTPEDARREALVRFGNTTIAREQVTAADAALTAGNLVRNARYALRQLRRAPGFAVTAVLALALGIGPNVAIFSMIYATFLAPMPYPDAKSLVVVWKHFKGDRVPTGGEEYAELAAESRSFESLTFQSWMSLHLTDADHTAVAEAGLPISPGMQSKTVGWRLLMGRDFLPEEGGPGQNRVVMLTNWTWRNRYYSDPNIIGKSILIEDAPYTVVGVMRAGPHERADSIAFFVPVRFTPGAQISQIGIMIGRLKPGVTLSQAQAELAAIDQRYAAEHFPGQDASAASLTVEHFRNDWLDLKIQRNLWLLLAAVGLVLLIACANLANLLLARGMSRRRELAVRAALGATRRQIFIQLMTESVTLSALGGAIGIALGWGLMKLSLALLPDLALQATDALVEMNVPVLCFAVAIAMLAGIVAGCAPGWRAARANQTEALKAGSRQAGQARNPLQAVLVAGEMALALVLLAGAGLALHSFWNLSRIDVGFTPDHVLTAMLRPLGNGSRGGGKGLPSPAEVVARQHQMLERVRALPGVLDAALTTQMPMRGAGKAPFAVAGQAVDKAHPPTADFQLVTPEYFRTLGIRLVKGRFLNEGDDLNSSSVAVVNETFVRRYLGGNDPLAQRIVKQPFMVIRDGHKTPPETAYQIVGVFHDVLNDGQLTGESAPQVYFSEWQTGWPWLVIAVRTVGDPAMITNALQRAVASVDAGLAIDHVETMDEVVGRQTSSDRFEMLLFSAFALVALLLAGVGIFGVMAFAVAQRTHEIGVRMALGARRSEVVRLMLRGGMAMALPGIGLGLAGALGLGWLMRATLYGVRMVDAGSLAAVAVLLLLVALAACWVPARRAAGVDPMRALRAE